MSNDTNKKLIEAIKAYGYWEEAPEIEKVVIEWINRQTERLLLKDKKRLEEALFRKYETLDL